MGANLTPEPDYDAEMKLPDGKRCDDCFHAKRCFGMGFSATGRTTCDFWPSRYREPEARRLSASLSGDENRSGVA